MKPSIRISISLLLALCVLIPSGMGRNISSAEEVNSASDTFAVYGINMDGGVNLSETRQTCDTITSRILSSSDDAEQRVDIGTMYLINSVLQMYRSINSSSRLMYWGLRFTNINVPQGAIIQSANVTYRAQSSSSFDYTSGHTYYGQADDDPTTFLSTVNNISGRNRTSASVEWVVPKWTSNTDFTSPDLSIIIQEIINRGGWQANNAMVIIGETTVNQNRVAHSFDSLDYSAYAPYLTISYCFEDTKYSIGDFVWEDDGDGVQEVGEPGVADVVVMLFTTDGAQIGQTVTDINGEYSFVDVSAGNYYLQFALPEGYSFTWQNQGSDPGLDSDVDVVTGQTAAFSWNAIASDLTWDAGLKRIYVTKSDRTVTAVPDEVSDCCQEYLVSQTVSASAPAEGITTPATLLTLSDTVADEFRIVPDSDTGCMTSTISEDGKTLTCNWDAQRVDTPTIITYQIRKASAGAIATSGSYATHISGNLQYTDHLGDQVALNYGTGTTTAALSGAEECQGDIEIEKTLMTGNVSAGNPVVFRLVVTNHSGFPLSGFVITDILDPLLSFTSANPSLCDYSGVAGGTYGGTVNCISSTSVADQGTLQIDLTTMFKPGSDDYFGENTATVSCPWCIVDSDSDNSISPTAVMGVVNFNIKTVPDIQISWESVDDTAIMGFRLFRESDLESRYLIYAIDTVFKNELTDDYYEYSDRTYLTGVTYKYQLQVLWIDGTITSLEPVEIGSPYISFLPLILE